MSATGGGSSSNSSGRVNTGGSKGFDFGSDDILCSYDDSSNGSHLSDPKQDFQKSRVIRSPVIPSISYSQPEDSSNQDVILAVERSMKKHADHLLRFLEGISSRLSQLELYCYNLDKSIGEMRSDLVRDHGEAESKLKSLEKHVQEVHRSVQILRDKQELADTQKELAKLQRAEKECSPSSLSQSGEEKTTPPAPEPKKHDKSNHLALALPHQVAPQLPPPPPAPQTSQTPPQNVMQQSYYLPPAQLPTPQGQSHYPQSQYLPSDPGYQTPQVQDVSRIAAQPPQQVNQTSSGQQFTHYQQQWPPQQVQPSQQPPMQPQIRGPSNMVYPPYPQPSQTTNSSHPETLPNSMPLPSSVPSKGMYSAFPQPLSSHTDTVPYGYGPGRTVTQQPPPQQIKPVFGGQTGDSYAAAGTPPPPGSMYMMYDGETGRTRLPSQQQQHFPQGGYPPSNLPMQHSQPSAGMNMLPRNPSHSHFIRNHPYGELIEKLGTMGFRPDHVVGVIQKMEESGLPIDFNAVLDRLNVRPSGGAQRGWSG